MMLKKIGKRRRAYDYKKVKDPMDQGYSPVQIASHIRTRSNQSLTHVMEKIKSERKKENAKLKCKEKKGRKRRSDKI
jgi:hypothetical protein